MHKAQWLGLVCGVMALLAVAGWILADEDDGDNGHEDDGRIPALEILEVLVDDLMTPADAVAKASEALGAGRAVEIHLDIQEEKGRRLVVWEVEFVGDGQMLEVRIDAKTGAVVEKDKENDEDEAAEYRELLDGGARSLQSVLANLDETVHGQVLAAELEEDDDMAVFEILVAHRGRAAEIEVNAATGKILPEEDDDDEEEDDDDDDHDDHDDEDHDDD